MNSSAAFQNSDMDMSTQIRIHITDMLFFLLEISQSIIKCFVQAW